jgi:hypothetical protein
MTWIGILLESRYDVTWVLAKCTVCIISSIYCNPVKLILRWLHEQKIILLIHAPLFIHSHFEQDLSGIKSYFPYSSIFLLWFFSFYMFWVLIYKVCMIFVERNAFSIYFKSPIVYDIIIWYMKITCQWVIYQFFYTRKKLRLLYIYLDLYKDISRILSCFFF